MGYNSGINENYIFAVNVIVAYSKLT